MFQVFDNGKPADCHHCKVHVSWDRSSFDTRAEAITYAIKWLGEWAPSNIEDLSQPYDYSGYGDTIEIKEVL